MGRRTGGRRELRLQLEENPDWAHDLFALYGFDLWDAIEGRVPIRRAYYLLDRLKYEPKSVWRAKQLGGPELKDYSRFLDWDSRCDLMADTIDAVNFSSWVALAINSPQNSQPPLPDPYPRPSDDVKKNAAVKKPEQTLDDFGKVLRGMFGPGHIGG